MSKGGSGACRVAGEVDLATLLFRHQDDVSLLHVREDTARIVLSAATAVRVAAQADRCCTHDVDREGQPLHVRGEPVEEDLDGLVVPVVGASCGVVAEVLDSVLAPEARLKLPEMDEVDDAGDAVLVALVGLWLVLRLGLELGLQGPELGLRASCASKTVRTRSQHWRDWLRTMVLLASWPWGISAPAAE